MAYKKTFDPKKTFKTGDIDTATVLKALGNKLINCFAKGSKKTIFVFYGENVIQDRNRFVNKELLIEPTELLRTFRELKTISHDTVENNKMNKRRFDE